LVVLGVVLEFFIMKPAELNLLYGIVGVERVQGTIDTIIVGTTLDPCSSCVCR
jgi:hypothetical protein